jgi:uncharacterized protein YcaQ
LRHHNSKSTKKILNELAEEKIIIPLKIKELDSVNYYTFPKNIKTFDKINEPTKLHILSPFDNLVIQRKRLSDLFGFDYVIECYVPAPKRKFGYFCMPVLYGTKFIGRIDAKADRNKGVLQVIKFFPEKDIRLNNMIRNKLEKKLLELAQFSGCSSISFKTA